MPDADGFATEEELTAAYNEWAAGDGPLELQAELDELERTDPAVARAAQSYDRMVEKMTGRMLPPRDIPAVCHHADGWEHPSDGSLPCTLERPSS
jgi:hypothetical protein